MASMASLASLEAEPVALGVGQDEADPGHR
jgi:hypothetical protein